MPVPEDFPEFPTENLFLLNIEAAAAFRFRKDGPAILHLQTDFGRTDISVGTEYGESGLPQTVCIVKVIAGGSELNSTGARWLNHVAGIMNCIAVATNTAVLDVQPVYFVDISPGRTNRQFYQQESTLHRSAIPSETRLVDSEASIEFSSCFFNSFDERDRLLRAIQQYVLALRYRTLDTKALAVAHVFMAAEALVPIARTRLQERDSLTLIQLAELGAKDAALKYPLRRTRDLQNTADQYARRTVIFHGDRKNHKKTKDLSDGFEHGYGEYKDLIKMADEVIDPAMDHVRRAIIELSPLEQTFKARLMDEVRFREPLGIHSHHIVTGNLKEPPGEAEHLPPLNLGSSPLAVNYDEEAGAYRFDVQYVAQATRNGVSDITLRARP